MSWVSVAWDWYAAHSDKVNPVIAGLGGAAVVWAAVRQARTATNRHYEQTRADQQRRLTESFSKAVEQLSDRDKIEARLGGIYTLERLAIEAIAQVRPLPWRQRLLLRRDRRRADRYRRQGVIYVPHLRAPPPADPVPDLYWTVMETLTAFVRERARWEEPQPSQPEMAAQSDLWHAGSQSDQARQQTPRPATDIAAVLAVLLRRPAAGREREKLRDWRLDLGMTDLRGAILFGAHFEGAGLRGAHLAGADLLEAHLEGAFLLNAHLAGADLRGAHLEGANLRGAYLKGADLRGAIGDAKTRLPDGVARPANWPPEAP